MNNARVRQSKRTFPDWLLGVSFAATWTWAVAVLVGMSILREQGIIPFALWFAANTSAIPFFGWLSRKYPGLWDQTRRAPMRALMSIMLIFTIWINMTGIRTAGDALAFLSPTVLTAIPILTLAAVWLLTRNGGIKWSVISDRFQWTFELGSVLVVLAITLFEHGGFVYDTSLKLGTYASPRDWMLGLWTIPLLLTNPFLDGTFWHRAAYAKSMRPYWWGWAMFMVYLVSVALIGFMGITPTASAILFVVIFFASFSTLDSCTAGLQLTAGKKLGNALGFLAIFGWIPIAQLGLLNVWIAFFVWYPFLFAIQIVTYHLEKRGILEPVSPETVAARDALPLIEATESAV